VGFSLKSSYFSNNDNKYGRKYTGTGRVSTVHLGFQRGQTVNFLESTRKRDSIKSRNRSLKIPCCHSKSAGTFIYMQYFFFFFCCTLF
jgi:hypothetical protein